MQLTRLCVWRWVLLGIATVAPSSGWAQTYQSVPGTGMNAAIPDFQALESEDIPTIRQAFVAFILSADDELQNPEGLDFVSLVDLAMYFQAQSDNALPCPDVGGGLHSVAAGSPNITDEDAAVAASVVSAEDDCDGPNPNCTGDCTNHYPQIPPNPCGEGGKREFDASGNATGCCSYGPGGGPPGGGSDWELTSQDGQGNSTYCAKAPPNCPDCPSQQPPECCPDDDPPGTTTTVVIPPTGGCDGCTDGPGPPPPPTTTDGGDGDGGGGGDDGADAAEAENDPAACDSASALQNAEGPNAASGNPVLIAGGFKQEADVDIVIPIPGGSTFRITRNYSGSRTVDQARFPWSIAKGWGISADGWFTEKRYGVELYGVGDYRSAIGDEINITMFPLSGSSSFHDLQNRTLSSTRPDFQVYEPLVPGLDYVWRDRTAGDTQSDDPFYACNLVGLETPGSGRVVFFDFSSTADPSPWEEHDHFEFFESIHGRIAATVDAQGRRSRFIYQPYYDEGDFLTSRLRHIVVNGDSVTDPERDATVTFDWNMGSDQTVGNGRMSRIQVYRPGLKAPTNEVIYTYSDDPAADGDYAHLSTTDLNLVLVENRQLINAPERDASGVVQYPSNWRPEYYSRFTHFRYEGLRLTHRFDAEQVEQFAEAWAAANQPSGTPQEVLRQAVEALLLIETGDPAFAQSEPLVEDFATKIIRYYGASDTALGFESVGGLAGRVREEIIQAGCGCSTPDQSKRITHHYQRRGFYGPARKFGNNGSSVAYYPIDFHHATIITEWEWDEAMGTGGDWKPVLQSVQWSQDRLNAEGFALGYEGTQPTVAWNKWERSTTPFTIGNATSEVLPDGAGFAIGRTWITYFEHDYQLPTGVTDDVWQAQDGAVHLHSYGTQKQVRKYNPSSVAGVHTYDVGAVGDFGDVADYDTADLLRNCLLNFDASFDADSPRAAFDLRDHQGLVEVEEYEPWIRAWNEGNTNPANFWSPHQGVSDPAWARVLKRGVRNGDDGTTTWLKTWDYLHDEHALSDNLQGRTDLVSKETLLATTGNVESTYVHGLADVGGNRHQPHLQFQKRVSWLETETSRQGEYELPNLTPLGSSAKVTVAEVRNADGDVVYAANPEGTVSKSEFHPYTGVPRKTITNYKPGGGWGSLVSGPDTTGWSSNTAPTFVSDTFADAAGLVVRQVDGNGLSKEFSHSLSLASAGLPSSTIDDLSVPEHIPLLTVTTSFFDLDGIEYRARQRQWATASLNVVRDSGFLPSGGSESEVSRTVHRYSLSGLLTETRSWWDVAHADRSYSSTYAYDGQGRLIRSVAANGETSETDYDIFGRAIERRGGASDTDLIWTSRTYYDAATPSLVSPEQDVGDGNATLTLLRKSAADTSFRAVRTVFDWRNRPRLNYTIDQSAGSIDTAINGTYSAEVLDEQGRAVERASFSGGSLSGLVAELLDSNSVGGEDLLTTEAFGLGSTPTRFVSRSRTAYSARSIPVSVEAALDPTASSPFTSVYRTLTFLDDVGRTTATLPPSGPVSFPTYDALGRAIATDVTDGGELRGLSDTTVLERAETQFYYDATDPDTERRHKDLPVLTTMSKRNHAPSTATANAGLGSAPVSTYAGVVYDSALRPVASINFGVNSSTDTFATGGTAPSVPLTLSGVASLSNVLVSQGGYDVRGRSEWSQDPLGRRTRSIFDDLGRVIATVENAYDGTQWIIEPEDVTWNTTDGRYDVAFGATFTTNHGTDVARTTSLVYDGADNVVKRVAHIPSKHAGNHLSDVQVTSYIYNPADVVLSKTPETAWPLSSHWKSRSLLHQIIYPQDKGTGSSVVFAYSPLGEQVDITDQRGVRRSFVRDDAGRVTEENVDFGLGSQNVDDTMNQVVTTYDAFGRATKMEAFDTLGNDRLNSVEYAFDARGRLSNFIQDPIGNRGLADDAFEPEKRINFGYEDISLGTGVYRSRASHVDYPFDVGTSAGTRVEYVYGDESSDLDHRLDRVTALALSDDAGTTAGNAFVTYRRMGLGSIVGVEYLDPQPSSPPFAIAAMDRTIGLDAKRRFSSADTTTYTTQAEGAYPGWDRYGRLKLHTWAPAGFDYDATPPVGETRPALVQEALAYDANSNRLALRERRSNERGTLTDRRMGYDALDRLSWLQEGRIDDSATFTAPDEAADTARLWNLDELGNWVALSKGKSEDFNAGAPESSTFDETLDGKHNKDNELTEFAGRDREYDKAGNLYKILNAAGTATERYFFYDAWNRLTRVTDAAINDIARYEYNALHWRTRVQSRKDATVNSMDRQRLVYFSPDWQVLLEDVDDGRSGIGEDHANDRDDDRVIQHFWGIRGVDDAVMTRLDDETPDTPEPEPGPDGVWDRSYWLLTDSQFSPVALLDAVGTIVERWRYRPYGSPIHRPLADLDGNGQINVDDVDIVALGVWDYDGDGVANVDDVDAWIADYQNPMKPETNHLSYYQARDGSTPADGADSRLGYAGYWWDAETGLWLGRHRVYDPEAGRWLQRDPAGYVDGLSLYLYVRGNPFSGVDPTGLIFEAIREIASALTKDPLQVLGGYYGEVASETVDLAVDAASGVADVAGGIYDVARGAGDTTVLGQLATDLMIDPVEAVSGRACAIGGAAGAHFDRVASGDLEAIGDTFTGVGTTLLPGAGALKVADRSSDLARLGSAARTNLRAASASPITGVDAALVRFSQSSVNAVNDVEASMRASGWQGGPIDVVKMSDGGLTSFDNTRLLAARRTGIDAQAVVRSGSDPFPEGRWTTKSGVTPSTWGEAVELRIGQQNRAFREAYPSGSPFTGSSQ